jgi:hypothetical protein
VVHSLVIGSHCDIFQNFLSNQIFMQIKLRIGLSYKNIPNQENRLYIFFVEKETNSGTCMSVD